MIRAFRRLLARRPTADELEILTNTLRYYQGRFTADRPAAMAYLGVGTAPLRRPSETAEIAAYAATISVIMNLDEAITK